ncbi:MAG: signal peptidase I [Thermodesulfobacteriota bacterium]|nr:signal peptidase I [Thermodesulfobacteriota bacterium]
MVKKENSKEKSTVREYVEAFIIALILALIIRATIIQAYKIPSGSMKPTLLVGDHILVNKFIYGWNYPFTKNKIFNLKTPKREDIIVFSCPVDTKKDFIKRVIGLPKERIQIKNKKIYINNKLFKDDHGYFRDSNTVKNRDNFGPIDIPEDSYFVLGDNRDKSYDSRFWGFVNIGNIKGKALIMYWSWDKENFGVRWRRIGSLIH